MKKIASGIKNILWLCKPYSKYGKLFLFISILTTVVYAPVDDFVYVRFPEMIISALASDKTFNHVLLIAVVMCGIAWLNDIIPDFFYKYLTKTQDKINLRIKKEIYYKALSIDYKYIDLPDYYDDFSWAMNEYVGQAYDAKEFVIDIMKYLASITVLVSIIASVSPWILLIECVQITIHALIKLRTNKNAINKKMK